MRILHYVSGLSPTIGGIEKFILNFYDAQKNNVDISIITRYYDKDTVMAKMFNDAGIRIFSLDIQHLGARNILVFKEKLNDFFKRYAKEFDVLHNNGIADPYVSAKARKYGINRIVAHVHSYSNLRVSVPDIIKKVSSYGNCNRSDCCLACSRDLALATYPKCFNKKVQVMNNGINTQEFDFNIDIRNEYRRMLGIEENFVVCTVGRMESIKNQTFLIDVFYEIHAIERNACLLLIGDGKLKEELISKCRDLNIIDRVHFLGERKDVNKLLQACDVFVLPSKNEGLGIAAIEAQASGLKTFVSADVIPKAIDCTGLVRFLDLRMPARKWAEIIVLESVKYQRESQISKIGNTDYDYKFSSKALLRIYR